MDNLQNQHSNPKKKQAANLGIWVDILYFYVFLVTSLQIVSCSMKGYEVDFFPMK